MGVKKEGERVFFIGTTVLPVLLNRLLVGYRFTYSLPKGAVLYESQGVFIVEHYFLSSRIYSLFPVGYVVSKATI